MPPKNPKKTDKPKKTRLHARAGLALPSQTIKRELRKRLPGITRCEKHVEILVTAHIEHCLGQTLSLATEHVKKGRYIKAEHLYKALNDKDSEIRNLFPKHIAGTYCDTNQE
jgi:hypothetical protein